jgi:glycosyltransferase involved in cell wall biosynthesis
MLRVEAKLFIAGKGRDEKKLRASAEEPGLSRKVELVGYADAEEKMSLLTGTNLLIVPSRYEGQGIVVLEAAACGKPVIVSDIPELQYAVDAGFGISFKTGDSKDLAQKIKFLLENEQLRREMGQKAREYARDYTWDKISLDYEQFLLKIIGNRK